MNIFFFLEKWQFNHKLGPPLSYKYTVSERLSSQCNKIYEIRGLRKCEFLLLSELGKISKSSFKRRLAVSGELIFLASYGNCGVKNTVNLLYDVTKQFLITIFDKHRNSPVVGI